MRGGGVQQAGLRLRLASPQQVVEVLLFQVAAEEGGGTRRVRPAGPARPLPLCRDSPQMAGFVVDFEDSVGTYRKRFCSEAAPFPFSCVALRTLVTGPLLWRKALAFGTHRCRPDGPGPTGSRSSQTAGERGRDPHILSLVPTQTTRRVYLRVVEGKVAGRKQHDAQAEDGSPVNPSAALLRATGTSDLPDQLRPLHPLSTTARPVLQPQKAGRRRAHLTVGQLQEDAADHVGGVLEREEEGDFLDGQRNITCGCSARKRRAKVDGRGRHHV